jgi:hypothetical protein
VSAVENDVDAAVIGIVVSRAQTCSRRSTNRTDQQGVVAAEGLQN